MSRLLYYVGNKDHAAARIRELLAPWSHLPYEEWFCGSAAVGLQIEGAYGSRVLNDMNVHLINALGAIRHDPEGTVGRLRALFDLRPPPTHYYQVRDAFNQALIPDAAHFLYLNRFCHNGLWRVNAAGRMNVPVGGRGKGADWKRHGDALCQAVLETAPKLKGVFLSSMPWTHMTEHFQSPTRIYADPPFAGDFVGYQRDRFTRDDTQALILALDRQADHGCPVILSNNTDNADLIPQTWTVEVLHRSGRMTRNKDERQPVAEILAYRMPA